jgi:molybdate transport system ATP-binding protein
MTESSIRIAIQQPHPIPLSVQLECFSGELLALVGPSGSGKTTLLRSIAGLYRPQHGHIVCQGETWQHSARNVFRPPYQRHVGMVFQQYALFPHMTVLQNIIQALPKADSKTQIKQAQTLLSKVHLDELGHRYPKMLSGGQQQRVAVARALARNPKVLLLDEPFSAVDQVTRRKLYRELVLLRQSLSMPIIMVTHDLDEAAMLADRIAVLHHGKILQTGTAEHVSAQPVSATVAKLMDQQNVFTAQVLEHNPHLNITRLLWRGQHLETVYQPQFAVKDRVCWLIQPANIILYSHDAASQGALQNRLSGQIVEYFELNGLALMQIDVDRQLKIRMQMNIPIHVAQRNNLTLNKTIDLVLLSSGIHLMPYEPLKRDI